MVPFQVENAGPAVTVAFEREPPGRSADALGEIVEDCCRPGRNVPAGGGGAGLGGTGLAQKQADDAALVGTERQPPAGSEIELTRMAFDLGEDGSQGMAAKSFLENPEGFRRPSALDDDELCGIEAEAVEPGPVGMTCLGEGAGLADQQERAMIALCETGKEGNGEAGRGARIAGGFAADLMQRIAAKPTRQHGVKGADAEGQACAMGRQADRPALDFSDPPAEPGKNLPCHGSACVHGHSNRPSMMFLFCSNDSGTRQKSQASWKSAGCPENQDIGRIKSCYRQSHDDHGPRRLRMTLKTGLLPALAFAFAVAAPVAAKEGARYQTLLTPLLETETDIIDQPIVYPSGTSKVTAAIVVIPPGEDTGWHTHEVPLFVHVLDGTVTVDYGDKGTKVYNAGETFMEAMNWPHNGINKEEVPARILAVYMGSEEKANTATAPRPQ
jgi:quercetin dioxygenase-like cupin family protein